MKIIDILNFYYNLFPVIRLCIHMDGGINGRYHDFTKDEALNFLWGYTEEEVIRADFRTYNFYLGKSDEKLEIPMLYIVYKSSMAD